MSLRADILILTRDSLWMVLNALGVGIRVAEDDPGQVVRFDVFPSCGSIFGLHDDHVSAISTLLQ